MKIKRLRFQKGILPSGKEFEVDIYREIEDQKFIVKEHNLLNDRITNFLTHLPDPSSSLFYLQQDKKYPEYKREHFVEKHHFSPQEFILKNLSL